MSVNQRDFVPRSGAEGDAARYNKESFQTCSLPRLLPSQRPLPTKSYVYKPQEDKLNPYRRSEASKLKLPPIRDTAKLRQQSTNNIKELKNQNYVLQQQLQDSKTENKLLKNVLHRHTVALQQFQDLEGSISQIQDQHRNEVKALRRLLSETRSSRDKLARKLQSTERELLDCKDRINHLQWRVNKNPNLLEKEELTRRLTEFTIHLEEKERRIQFLEKSNMLLQSSLNRQVATEYKKMFRTNVMSLGLQTAVCELSKKTQPDRTREAETNNINTIRLRKHGRKAKQSKMVQTEERVSTTSETDDRMKSDISETDEKLQRWQSPDSSDYLRHKSRTTEQRRKNNQNHSDTNAVSAYGDIHHRQEERKHLSEDTQESEESEEEEEEKEGSKDEEEGEEEEEGEDENEDREGGERSEENCEGKEEKEEHDEEEYDDEGMDQNGEEDETEEKEEKSEETSFGEKFEETIGEYDYDEEERDYEKEEEDKGELEEEEWEGNAEEWEEDEENEEEEKEDKKKKKKKKVKEEREEEESQVVEEQEEENELEEAQENRDEEDKVRKKERVEKEESVEEEVDDEEEDEAVVEVMMVVEEAKQQEKRKEKGDQKDIRTNKQCSLSCILNEPQVVTPREPKRCSRPKIRRKYNFTPVTKNLHLGKPAYSGVNLRSYKGANMPVKEETLYCRNRRRSAEMLEDIYLSDEQTSQPDAASDCSDLDSKHTDSPSWT
ncbi:histone-lysine N-methyltransferase, H3 lysine-79 specific-like isoform X2 [Phyllopteryx taeniolatus]|uniref:histone-lysine N-methyltransferase, H3 lysine-79 specific-like isoform X2 n=1 Tax=Phyllopteryx taeniolatus TaxID=161469 RepID=UPI002AD38BEB|nr:histone-lysine N-methyltransferase, H3 lysine-79 specific-like isoform X2 [Phyllopteryx taeniolatus]